MPKLESQGREKRNDRDDEKELRERVGRLASQIPRKGEYNASSGHSLQWKLIAGAPGSS